MSDAKTTLGNGVTLVAGFKTTDGVIHGSEIDAAKRQIVINFENWYNAPFNGLHHVAADGVATRVKAQTVHVWIVQHLQDLRLVLNALS